MQEHREVAADGPKAAREHALRRGADDDVIAIGDRPPEQLVAHRTADAIDLHGARDLHLRRRLASNDRSAARRRRQILPARRPRARVGCDPKSAGNPQSQTLSSCIDARLSRLMSLPGSSSRSVACSLASAAPSGTMGRRRPVSSPDVGDQLAQRVDLRPAQRVALRVACGRRQSAHERTGRRRRRRPAGSARRAHGQRDHRQHALEARKQVEKASPRGRRSPTGRKIVQARPDCGDERFGLALAAQVAARPRRVGVEGAHVQQARARRPRGRRRRACRASSTCTRVEIAAAATR